VMGALRRVICGGPLAFRPGRPDGGVAQLGEHLLCKQGVIGSIPIVSTTGTLLEGAGRGARFGSNSIVEIKSSVWLAVGNRAFLMGVSCRCVPSLECGQPLG
jgi:hypothetical protein